MVHKGITPRGNFKVQLPKFNLKVTAVYPGPKPLPHPPITPHQSSGILDTNRNNCGSTNKQRGYGPSKQQKKWVKRAKGKSITYQLSTGLSNYIADRLLWTKENSGQSKVDNYKWSKRYEQSKACCHVLEQIGEKVTSWYCRQKWCSVCARNKGMKLLHAYKDQIERLPNLYIVTLTIVSMPGDQLSYAIERMNNAWRKIRDKMNDKGMRPKGVIALEVTHGLPGYHPHFHILISGMENALMVQKEWLKHFKNEAGQGGQDVKKVRNIQGANLEIFKYAVKSIKDGVMYSPEVMHTINQATFRRQMVRPFGIVKAKPEDIEAPKTEVSKVDWLPKVYANYRWNDYYKDWISSNGIEFSNRRYIEAQKVIKTKNK